MSIIDSAKYDLKRICQSGDVSTAVTYKSQSALQVDTRVILTNEVSVTEDGQVLGSFISAVVQRDDVDAPEAGDTFFDATNLVTYKVLEIIKREDVYTTALVETI